MPHSANSTDKKPPGLPFGHVFNINLSRFVYTCKQPYRPPHLEYEIKTLPLSSHEHNTKVGYNASLVLFQIS